MENQHPTPVNSAWQGLDDSQVREQRRLFGQNTLPTSPHSTHIRLFRETVTEPMFLLLLLTVVIYFIIGEYREMVILLVALIIVSSISFFQQWRSASALKTLQDLTEPKTSVWRNRQRLAIPVEEVVVGDAIMVEEGVIVPADGILVEAFDLSVNESMLTGESLPVLKDIEKSKHVYRGTMVISGYGVFRVTEVGAKTLFGQIGKSLQIITQPSTPLQRQIKRFVQRMAWFGLIAFVLVVTLKFGQSGQWINALLHGLSLAMSIIPEEIPVAFMTFLALGAFRLLKENKIIARLPQYVETLGSATVICIDKTGTITQNQMSLQGCYSLHDNQVLDQADLKPGDMTELWRYALLSSEVNPFDPMEKEIQRVYKKNSVQDWHQHWKLIHEYPLSGKPAMMTHIFQDQQRTIIAIKGAPEALMMNANLSADQREKLEAIIETWTGNGFRVLGVGKSTWKEARWPVDQNAFQIEILGLLAFYDPPKPTIGDTIGRFREAGIRVKMITGDHAKTALSIARQIGMETTQEVLTGDQVISMTLEELKQKVNEVVVFARMYPEAKVRVVEALKENNEVVAMTGDGVNDAPALQAAHIGIAMGKRGSAVAKSASALILTDDDLSHMVDAIRQGRRVYANLKKAVRYIISIHIPIILVVTMPLLLGWQTVDLFFPIHIIFLELIMGPTCSIVYENEPPEPGLMQQTPVPMTSTFLSTSALWLSILQGIVIAAGLLIAGHWLLRHGGTEKGVRTLFFFTCMFSNIFLTLLNRSFEQSVFRTLITPNRWMWFILLISSLLTVLIASLPVLRDLFFVNALTTYDWLLYTAIALCTTAWFEIWKWVKRRIS